ncbi:hypothetical protein AMECASPLE_014433, partial [Ameca splendens]
AVQSLLSIGSKQGHGAGAYIQHAMVKRQLEQVASPSQRSPDTSQKRTTKFSFLLLC